MPISAFFLGEVAPFWPHFILITVAVLGSGAVAWGIIREADSIRSLTTLLVVIGVAVEAICTILLFGFDEGITSRQQETIIELSPRNISVGRRAEMIAALKPYAGISASLVTYLTDAEGRRLAAQLEGILKAAGLDTPYGVHTCGLPSSELITGLYVTSTDMDPTLRRFRETLLSLLEETGIKSQGGHEVHCLMPVGTVEIWVGVKPIPEGNP